MKFSEGFDASALCPGCVRNTDGFAKAYPGWRLGRFQVLLRSDGQWIVYDPRREFGARKAWGPGVLEDALLAMSRLSARADGLGEPNSRERLGYELDWGDPKTWERTANAEFPPLISTTKRRRP